MGYEQQHKKQDRGPEGEGPKRNRVERNEKILKGSYGNYKRIRQTTKRTDKFESDPYGQVINLSKQSFTKTEYKLLGYNLNFVSTPKSVDKEEFLLDIKRFNRRIKLKSHFGDSPKDNLYFKSTSTWEPTDIHHTVKTFTEDFGRKVERSLEIETNNVSGHRKNLNKEELQAMEDLRNRDEIIITKADKGEL